MSVCLFWSEKSVGERAGGGHWTAVEREDSLFRLTAHRHTHLSNSKLSKKKIRSHVSSIHKTRTGKIQYSTTNLPSMMSKKHFYTNSNPIDTNYVKHNNKLKELKQIKPLRIKKNKKLHHKVTVFYWAYCLFVSVSYQRSLRPNVSYTVSMHFRWQILTQFTYSKQKPNILRHKHTNHKQTYY